MSRQYHQPATPLTPSPLGSSNPTTASVDQWTVAQQYQLSRTTALANAGITDIKEIFNQVSMPAYAALKKDASRQATYDKYYGYLRQAIIFAITTASPLGLGAAISHIPLSKIPEVGNLVASKLPGLVTTQVNNAVTKFINGSGNLEAAVRQISFGGVPVPAEAVYTSLVLQRIALLGYKGTVQGGAPIDGTVDTSIKASQFFLPFVLGVGSIDEGKWNELYTGALVELPLTAGDDRPVLATKQAFYNNFSKLLAMVNPGSHQIKDLLRKIPDLSSEKALHHGKFFGHNNPFNILGGKLKTSWGWSDSEDERRHLFASWFIIHKIFEARTGTPFPFMQPPTQAFVTQCARAVLDVIELSTYLATSGVSKDEDLQGSILFWALYSMPQVRHLFLSNMQLWDTQSSVQSSVPSDEYAWSKKMEDAFKSEGQNFKKKGTWTATDRGPTFESGSEWKGLVLQSSYAGSPNIDVVALFLKAINPSGTTPAPTLVPMQAIHGEFRKVMQEEFQDAQTKLDRMGMIKGDTIFAQGEQLKSLQTAVDGFQGSFGTQLTGQASQLQSLQTTVDGYKGTLGSMSGDMSGLQQQYQVLMQKFTSMQQSMNDRIARLEATVRHLLPTTKPRAQELRIMRGRR